MQAFYIQILTTFKDINHLQFTFHRVTTIRRLFVSNPTDLLNSFDQEAALHALTKQVIERSVEESSDSVRNWLDTMIIKWAIQFGTYKKG